MNTLTKITTFIIGLVLILLSTTSCVFDGLNGIRGNRHVVTEDRNLSGDFDAIKVQQGIHVYISQGDETEATVEADENIIDLLKTEVRNGELKIYFEKNVYRAASRKVYLTVDELSEIRTSSGASVKSENTLMAEHLTLDSSSGSSMKLTIDASSVECETSSGADIDIFGSADEIGAKSSSGSSIDADDLKAKIGNARASSGGHIDLYVTEKLTAKASSGGDIDYRGNPSVSKNTSSGGSVSGS